MKRHHTRRTKRPGYVLVLFVMMFFGLMGLAALVIDMGFARLAQRQMQSAVDSAALEGLRWRDQFPIWLSTDPEFLAMRPGFQPASPSSGDIDCARRLLASRVVSYRTPGSTFTDSGMFSDYVDGAGGTVFYGAGPVVNFSGGIGPPEWAASQLMQPGNPPVYQPQRADRTPGLELNLNTNATEGDMVAGTYGSNPSYQPAPGGWNDENSSYGRCDFTPALPGSSASSAFLVRMRRTNNLNGLDQEPGISSSGPTLPVLFGRGSMMARSGGSGQLSVSSGITVRATAIASTGPARTVGRPFAAASLPGSFSAVLPNNTAQGQLYYVVLNLSTWSTLTNSSTFTFTISTNGSLLSSSGTTCGYLADGSAVDSSDLSTVYPNGRPFLGSAAMVGDQANQISADPVALTTELMQELSPTGVAYIPVVEDNASRLLFGRVIGFGYVTGVQPSGSNGITFTTGSIGTIASQNASCVLGVVLPAAFANPSSGLALTAQLFSGYPASANDLMLAPVLVNHYIGPNP